MHDVSMPFGQSEEKKILSLFEKKSLRPGQRALLKHILDGHNALGILPTGYGKSLCYQAAAVLMGGTSVVISPLIALMRDQVQGLRKLGIEARSFDSTLEKDERSTLLHQIKSGRVRLLFIAPESIDNPLLQQALATTQLSLFVVDEAHCVSEWGHSFRPDYLKLPAWQKKYTFRCILALTATATDRVREDLCDTFHIEPQCVTLISPYRSNITRLVMGANDRDKELQNFLHDPTHRPAIIYARTRKETETLAARLSSGGLPAAYYHAYQPTEVRAKLQDDFLDNRLQLLVATIAFGMGIDKPDVRTVVHYNAPSSPESYLQESGRAGRDGLPAWSLVLLHGDDLIDARNRIYAAEPDPEGVLRAVRWLQPAIPQAVSLWELSTACDVPENVALRALTLLQEADAITIESRGYKYYKIQPLFSLSTILDGRDMTEAYRLRWLDNHREGEVEDAALAWNCTYDEAMEQLRECEASHEWKLTFRQQALYIHPQTPIDPKMLAAKLSSAYATRREADLARFQLITHILTEPTCLNTALECYFNTGKTTSTNCGHCSACCGQHINIPPATPTLPPPPDSELPHFDRPNQRKRFLLGLASPNLLSRRLWKHSCYAAAAGTRWEEL